MPPPQIADGTTAESKATKHNSQGDNQAATNQDTGVSNTGIQPGPHQAEVRDVRDGTSHSTTPTRAESSEKKETYKVDANGGDVAFRVCVVREAQQQSRLPVARAASQFAAASKRRERRDAHIKTRLSARDTLPRPEQHWHITTARRHTGHCRHTGTRSGAPTSVTEKRTRRMSPRSGAA